MSNEERVALEDGMHALGITPNEHGVRSMLAYLDILEETNRSFNLTRIPRSDYVTLHLLDSLTCFPALLSLKVDRILDVGTGAGFPGVPLAAMLPTSQVVVLDATAKKVRFVAETAGQVGIANLTGVHGRAEALARTPEYREQFDVVVSRAVAPFPKLVELLLPLVRVGGIVVALKGQGFEEEVDAAGSLVAELGGSIERIDEVQLPSTDITRYNLIIKKVKATPGRFPRKGL